MKPFMVKQIPSKEFRENTTIPLTLPLGGKIGKGILILEGTVTLANGTTSGAAKGEGGPINLIKNIIVRCNPAAGSRYKGGEVVNASPRALLRYAITKFSKFIGDLGGSSLGSGAAAAYPVYLAIPMFFADPNSAFGWQSAINADVRAHQSIQIEVETGDITDCFTGNDRDATYDLSIRWFDERHDIPGDTFELFQTSHQTLIPATKKDFVDDRLTKKGGLLELLLMTESTAAETLVDTILNKVKMSNEQFEFELTDQDIRQRMFNDGWYDAAQVATGQYFIDFVDGRYYKGIGANPMPAAVAAATLQHEFDITMISSANVDALHMFQRFVFVPAEFNPSTMKEYGTK